MHGTIHQQTDFMAADSTAGFETPAAYKCTFCGARECKLWHDLYHADLLHCYFCTRVLKTLKTDGREPRDEKTVRLEIKKKLQTLMNDKDFLEMPNTVDELHPFGVDQRDYNIRALPSWSAESGVSKNFIALRLLMALTPEHDDVMNWERLPLFPADRTPSQSVQCVERALFDGQ